MSSKKPLVANYINDEHTFINLSFFNGFEPDVLMSKDTQKEIKDLERQLERKKNKFNHLKEELINLTQNIDIDQILLAKPKSLGPQNKELWPTIKKKILQLKQFLLCC